MSMDEKDAQATKRFFIANAFLEFAIRLDAVHLIKEGQLEKAADDLLSKINHVDINTVK